MGYEVEESSARPCRNAQSFPNAVILTESRVPSPIFAAIMLGPRKLLCIELDTQEAPETFVDQVRRILPSRLADGGVIPCFGRVTGFVINFDAERSVEFDLAGRKLRDREAPYLIHDGSLSLK